MKHFNKIYFGSLAALTVGLCLTHLYNTPKVRRKLQARKIAEALQSEQEAWDAWDKEYQDARSSLDSHDSAEQLAACGVCEKYGFTVEDWKANR